MHFAHLILMCYTDFIIASSLWCVTRMVNAIRIGPADDHGCCCCCCDRRPSTGRRCCRRSSQPRTWRRAPSTSRRSGRPAARWRWARAARRTRAPAAAEASRRKERATTFRGRGSRRRASWRRQLAVARLRGGPRGGGGGVARLEEAQRRVDQRLAHRVARDVQRAEGGEPARLERVGEHHLELRGVASDQRGRDTHVRRRRRCVQ